MFSFRNLRGRTLFADSRYENRIAACTLFFFFSKDIIIVYCVPDLFFFFKKIYSSVRSNLTVISTGGHSANILVSVVVSITYDFYINRRDFQLLHSVTQNHSDDNEYE